MSEATAVQPWMLEAAHRIIHGKQAHSDWDGARPPHLPEQACEWAAMSISESAEPALRAAEKRAADAEEKADACERHSIAAEGEIGSLRIDLADAERERDEAREQVLALKDQAKCSCDYDEPGPCLYHQRQIDRALSASQAREQRLREALKPLAALAEHFEMDPTLGICIVSIGGKQVARLTGADAHAALAALAESGEALAPECESCKAPMSMHACPGIGWREGPGVPEAPAAREDYDRQLNEHITNGSWEAPAATPGRAFEVAQDKVKPSDPSDPS